MFYEGKVDEVVVPELLVHSSSPRNCDISHSSWAAAVNCVVVKQLTTKVVTIRKYRLVEASQQDLTENVDMRSRMKFITVLAEIPGVARDSR
jgi:hypothetical protein